MIRGTSIAREFVNLCPAEKEKKISFFCRLSKTSSFFLTRHYFVAVVERCVHRGTYDIYNAVLRKKITSLPRNQCWQLMCIFFLYSAPHGFFFNLCSCFCFFFFFFSLSGEKASKR